MSNSCYVIFRDKDKEYLTGLIMDETRCLPEEDIKEIWGNMILKEFKKRDHTLKIEDIEVIATENEDIYYKRLSNSGDL